MRSIQSRLAGSLVISLIVILMLQWVLVGSSIRYLSEAYIATRLEHDAQAIVAALQLNQNPVTIAQDRIDPIYSRPFSGHYFKIQIGENIIRSRSLWDTELRMVDVPPGQITQGYEPGPQMQELLVLHSTYKKNQHKILISVAEDLTPIIKDINAFQVRYALISLGILSILVLIQAYIVKRNLTPLEKVRRELKNLEQGIISQLSERVPSEVLPLVQELNHQLIAIKKRLQRSRSATGNLAHALKTPLTLIMQIADSDALENYPEIKQQLTRQADSIKQNVDRELSRARVAGEHIAGRRTSLLKEINGLVETLSAMYRAKPVVAEIDVNSQITCTMDRQDMVEVLGNIMDNSYKWAKSKVKISAQQNGAILFIVEDDGPGADLQDIESLVKRGNRADEHVSGHGLGLSIVSDILAEYDGGIEFFKSPELGGLGVKVRIS